jgi:hypothetical protein
MLRFECNELDAGWLEATIADRTSSAELLASYLSDAPTGQVTSQLAALLERYGEDGYQEQWDYPFPCTEYETLLRFQRARRTKRT